MLCSSVIHIRGALGVQGVCGDADVSAKITRGILVDIPWGHMGQAKVDKARANSKCDGSVKVCLSTE